LETRAFFIPAMKNDCDMEAVMAKKNEEFVAHIAKRSEDFPQWYTDVVLKTDMADYSDVKGCMVIKPYGYPSGS